MPLPRWIASHQEFLDELKRRAPNIEVGNAAELRKHSFTSYVGAPWFLVVFAALALSPCLYVPSLKAAMPWVTEARLAAGFVVMTILLILYQDSLTTVVVRPPTTADAGSHGPYYPLNAGKSLPMTRNAARELRARRRTS
jgi:hypothetical protein